MRRLLIISLLIIPVLASAQKEKEYKISSYEIWTLWQDTIWTQTESVDDADFKCHVHYDSLGLWGKFIINNEIYSVYSELEKKELNVEDYITKYMGKGKLVYRNKEIEVIYWEKMFDLYAIRIEMDDRQILFQLEKD